MVKVSLVFIAISKMLKLKKQVTSEVWFLTWTDTHTVVGCASEAVEDAVHPPNPRRALLSLVERGRGATW